MDNKETLNIFKALGEETRLKIFEILKDGELCACEIQERFDLTQPTLSHHLKVLCDCGIVKGVKDGKWTHYALNCEMLDSVIRFVSDAKCKREKNKCR